MKNNQLKKIFKQGSTTYYYSSIFFPNRIKNDVMRLYAFVRTADDFVDSIPQKKDEFLQFYFEAMLMLQGKSIENEILLELRKLIHEKSLEKQWIKDFLKAMKLDLAKRQYKTFNDLEKYMYGSAEVVGLCMAKILNLPRKSYVYAKMQGKAMQFVNFIRDIQEDLDLGRIYLPMDERKKFGNPALPPLTNDDKNKCIKFIRYEIKRFYKFQKRATGGYSYIPKRTRIMVKTASDMYLWTANKIFTDPLIVFQKKVKPHPLRIFLYILINTVFA